MDRSAFISVFGLCLVGAAAAPSPTRMVTYRDAGCGCCEGWVRAARSAGYDVALHDLDRTQRLARFGLTDATAGCHTSLVGGYIVEGHVPLVVIARLLRERPHLRGIAVPGMPTGVPGMPGARTELLEVMTMESKPRVYARVP